MSPVLKFVNSSKALKFKRLEKKHISSNKKKIYVNPCFIKEETLARNELSLPLTL